MLFCQRLYRHICAPWPVSRCIPHRAPRRTVPCLTSRIAYKYCIHNIHDWQRGSSVATGRHWTPSPGGGSTGGAGCHVARHRRHRPLPSPYLGDPPAMVDLEAAAELRKLAARSSPRSPASCYGDLKPFESPGDHGLRRWPGRPLAGIFTDAALWRKGWIAVFQSVICGLQSAAVQPNITTGRCSRVGIRRCNARRTLAVGVLGTLPYPGGRPMAPRCPLLSARCPRGA